MKPQRTSKGSKWSGGKRHRLSALPGLKSSADFSIGYSGIVNIKPVSVGSAPCTSGRGIDMIRLAVLLVLLSAAEISTEGYVVVDPPEAVVCELGWCYVLEPEMTWRVNDTRN